MYLACVVISVVSQLQRTLLSLSVASVTQSLTVQNCISLQSITARQYALLLFTTDGVCGICCFLVNYSHSFGINRCRSDVRELSAVS